MFCYSGGGGGVPPFGPILLAVVNHRIVLHRRVGPLHKETFKRVIKWVVSAALLPRPDIDVDVAESGDIYDQLVMKT